MSISGLALRAYQTAASIGAGGDAAGSPGFAAPGGAAGADFGAVLGRTLGDAVRGGHEADRLTTQALTGQGDLTQVVTAVSRAQLALQTTVALRDRVLQAYQDIIRMPI